MGRGYQVLGTAWGDFRSVGLQDNRLHTDHMMMLEVISGEGKYLIMRY